MLKKNNDWLKEFEEEKRADTLEEERLDRMAAPKAMNSRKSMIPVLIYKILVDCTSPEHHITQKELCRILANNYELLVDYKTLMRHVHTLCDEGVGLRYSSKGGIWYDPESVWDVDYDFSAA